MIPLSKRAECAANIVEVIPDKQFIYMGMTPLILTSLKSAYQFGNEIIKSSLKSTLNIGMLNIARID